MREAGTGSTGRGREAEGEMTDGIGKGREADKEILETMITVFGRGSLRF